MAPLKKLEVDAEIQAPAHLLHDVLTYKPHFINTMAPDKIQNCCLQSDNKGTILSVDYFHDGKKSLKAVIEKIDEKNLSTTWKVMEGDLLSEYKNVKFGLQATPTGSGSLVHVTMEYEKINENTPDPHSMMNFCALCINCIDAHLINPQLNHA